MFTPPGTIDLADFEPTGELIPGCEGTSRESMAAAHRAAGPLHFQSTRRNDDTHPDGTGVGSVATYGAYFENQYWVCQHPGWLGPFSFLRSPKALAIYAAVAQQYSASGPALWFSFLGVTSPDEAVFVILRERTSWFVASADLETQFEYGVAVCENGIGLVLAHPWP